MEKLGLNQYLSYKKITMTTNQETEKDGYVCLTSWNLKKNWGFGTMVKCIMYSHIDH